MTPMNPFHRNWANYVLEWLQQAGIKIKEEYGDMEVFNRFFQIGMKTKRWDYYTFVDSDNVMIGWDGVPYAFMIYGKENRVQRINNG